jgi:plasmid stabilization system protein ParE
MRVRYTLRARNYLDAIYRYLDERSSIAAQSVKRAIERRISRLADFPLMGPATEEPGVHELTIIRYPYKVYYRIEENEVRIVHIRHTARRTPDTSKF